ncbi:MAG TPA: site-specific DNA-methyltransferase [Stellaceae bacterium]|nr:site-specific DNA-methyltransferase [Stellaceae bacterium]
MGTKTFPILQVEYLPASALKLDPGNAKQHSERQIEQIARSIECFGFNVPILVDHENIVRAGTGRYLACQKRGWNEVPIIRLAHLTEAQARAFAIADNRLTELGTWNDQLLGEIFRDLAAAELDFSLEVTGFSMGEIDLQIEGLSQDRPDSADELPTVATQIAVTRPNDIWHLGRHRVLCGNALDSIAYEPLMQGAVADLIFTDPPFNVPIDGHASGNGQIHHREFAMAAGEMTAAQYTEFLIQICKRLAQNSVDGAIHYLCMDWRHMGELLSAGQAAYTELKNVCVWVKDNGGLGSFYRSQHELIFVFKSGTARHRNNIQLGKFGRNRTNVWAYPGANTLSRGGEEGNLLALHPTVKPVALIADAILDCSARGDIVLDPFLGSGSTLIAAERVGRICYGIEIDPLYIDTAIRRWQRYTGGEAIHAMTGKSFDAMAAEREGRHA